ncbi:cellulase family glycosylhydrolase [Bacteroides ihuae]|uniref:cellulase family glycosylhydrolase n=1 Tax=Bacteroides ihuae TaxID=1852362 RepID=UPI000AAFBED5|nr:cellulase family glycosylhydrolase [Bacteroides ihuae]
MKITIYSILLLWVASVSFFSCKDENYIPLMTVSAKSISFPDDLDSLNLSLTTDDKWNISFDDATIPNWLQLDQTSGNSGSSTIKIETTSLNTTGATRRAIIRITCDNGQARRIKVYQAPKIYPSYNISPIAPDATGMGSTATELVAKIKLGINIGNTLELRGVNVDPTEAYIKFVKQSGFNAVRIPCAWNFSSNLSTAKIDDTFMAKVKQVVQWCVENDMYVLLNIHWDGGWLEENCTVTKQDSVNAKQKAFWGQIATAMRDFDEHLMFASANEPNAETPETMEVLLSYHKTFIDAVRSTGGHNTYRTLVLQGDTRQIDPSVFPTDPTPDRLAFEWHNYSPTSFTILDDDPPAGWDFVRFYWGEGNHSTIEPERNCTYGEEAELLKDFKQIKTQFIDKGIPVLMGEYSAQRWEATSKFVPKELDKHNASVDAWITYLTKQCLAIGAKPFYWETGGVFDRVNDVVLDQRSLDAIIVGSK